MMFRFPIYDVLHSVLWCFGVHSMIDCNPFYDRLQPILWCFERLRMMFFISTKWKLSFEWVKASQTISNRFLPLGRTGESETLHRKTQTIRMLCNIWRVFEKTKRLQYDENTFLISKIFVRFLQIFVLIFVPLCLRVSLITFLTPSGWSTQRYI